MVSYLLPRARQKSTGDIVRKEKEKEKFVFALTSQAIQGTRTRWLTALSLKFPRWAGYRSARSVFDVQFTLQHAYDPITNFKDMHLQVKFSIMEVNRAVMISIANKSDIKV